MLRYLIILVFIGLVIWKGKPYLMGLFLKWREKKLKKPSYVKDELIYSPIESSRTFEFKIQIDEMGGGKVKMTIVK